MFFQFRQNNSFGSFTLNEDLSHLVIIEANSPTEANDKAIRIGIYFDRCEKDMDCPCCGDRWYPCKEHNQVEIVSVLESWHKADRSKWMPPGKEIVIHFASGRKEWH
jgi:hypothetical protein